MRKRENDFKTKAFASTMICLGKRNQLDFTFKEILHSFQMNNPFSNNDTGWIKLRTKTFHRRKLISSTLQNQNHYLNTL